MIREILFDTLVGIIALAILGFAAELLGPTMALLLTAASIIGFLLRPAFDARRRAIADARMLSTMNRNRERMGIVPIGRASRPRLEFPDRPIIPTRDATFGE
jgi:hypothetical protein